MKSFQHIPHCVFSNGSVNGGLCPSSLQMYLQVLALVGDQLEFGENICGAVLSIRFNEDIVSIWNRNASDHQVQACLILWLVDFHLRSSLFILILLFFSVGGNGFKRLYQAAPEAAPQLCNGVQASRCIST